VAVAVAALIPEVQALVAAVVLAVALAEEGKSIN